MLPESTFPVTGGIMQTEEVGICSKSTGLDCSRTEDPTFNHPPHFKQDTQCPVSSLVYMTVKQEPQEVDVNAASVQEDADSAAGTSDDDHQVHQTQQNLQEPNGKTLEISQTDANKVRPSRGRRKSRWKLKFHHQALPPEYLDHYEAALAQEALNASPVVVPEAPTAPTATSSSTILNPIADVQRWLQRIAIMQQELCPPGAQTQTSPPNPNFRRSVITSTPMQSASYNTAPHPQKYQQPMPRPPMKYSDLPYMGEITLDNSKPRRGRKPKKADICHLIYKNYGTILPGTPGHEDKCQIAREKCEKAPQIAFQRSDIQNRISSLLEKRLTQESKKSFVLQSFKEQEEPLNLCVRDMNPLKAKLMRSSESNLTSSSSAVDQEDVEILGTPYSNDPDSSSQVESLSKKDDSSEHGSSPNPGFVYWPNAGVFIHPMTLQSQFLYYQKMDQQRKNLLNTDHVPQDALKIVPKTQSPVLDNKCPTPTVSRLPPNVNASLNVKRAGNQNQPIKRKRSAIFIPPMPTENNNNPATEVSICKFKFTGGAKPSLQEKKSLSVDSGGNFRYYSGTGDKSMRGYEFFPRESLQQSAGQSGSSAGTFLSAAAERVTQPNSHTEKTIMNTVNPDDGRRKRKTRKSLQREKLEQTFKEKGFLIQTQQLESAEGATYCKFRQLRKFTRYLFRSWKDYLPGNVRELTDGMEAEAQEGIAADDEARPNLADVPVNILEDSRILPLT